MGSTEAVLCLAGTSAAASVAVGTADGRRTREMMKIGPNRYLLTSAWNSEYFCFDMMLLSGSSGGVHTSTSLQTD